ncbi:manD [Acrasis kona]|uniref:mannan endo-1,4-beta-mannosidase n=1 Tax=Acrasis kona TaxID=1008807 RepID=A0AAW2YNT5_9EUKA
MLAKASLVLAFLVGLALANSWAGVNSYFIHTLEDNDRRRHLDAIRDAGLKVLRVFVVSVGRGSKGSSSRGVNDIEAYNVGKYDDTVLNQINVLMKECYDRGIKLNIALHDRYSLGCWARDAYVGKYGLRDVSPKCSHDNQPSKFYFDSNAQADYDRRIAHIVNYRNPIFNNRRWGEINEAILSFNIENENQGHVDNKNLNWQCGRAKAIRQYLSNGVLISTGGGAEFWDSLPDQYFQCKEIDIVTLHSYDTNAGNVRNNIKSALDKARRYGKRVIYEEFGVQGNDNTKVNGMRPLIDVANELGVPFMPWEILNPANDKDFEFGTSGQTYEMVKQKSYYAQSLSGAFNWAEIKTGGGGKKKDWDPCQHSSECEHNCCSEKYSQGQGLKCHPSGSTTECV